MVGGELVRACMQGTEGRDGGAGEVEDWGVCSLILEENVEEINLNCKDKASLESGSGNGYTGKGSTGNRHYGSSCFVSACFDFSFILIR